MPALYITLRGRLGPLHHAAIGTSVFDKPCLSSPAGVAELPAETPPRALRVGVGVGVLVIRDGLLLLGRRRGSHGAGTWAAPGGQLEFGEQIEACARRELAEETGLVARSIELGPYTNDVFEAEARHFVTVFVTARGALGAPRNLEPGKCDGWAWFAWDEMPVPLFQPLQSLRAIGWRPGGV